MHGAAGDRTAVAARRRLWDEDAPSAREDHCNRREILVEAFARRSGRRGPALLARTRRLLAGLLALLAAAFPAAGAPHGSQAVTRATLVDPRFGECHERARAGSLEGIRGGGSPSRGGAVATSAAPPFEGLLMSFGGYDGDLPRPAVPRWQRAGAHDTGPRARARPLTRAAGSAQGGASWGAPSRFCRSRSGGGRRETCGSRAGTSPRWCTATRSGRSAAGTRTTRSPALPPSCPTRTPYNKACFLNSPRRASALSECRCSAMPRACPAPRAPTLGRRAAGADGAGGRRGRQGSQVDRDLRPRGVTLGARARPHRPPRLPPLRRHRRRGPAPAHPCAPAPAPCAVSSVARGPAPHADTAPSSRSANRL
jgi:hypothetical protein